MHDRQTHGRTQECTNSATVSTVGQTRTKMHAFYIYDVRYTPNKHNYVTFSFTRTLYSEKKHPLTYSFIST